MSIYDAGIQEDWKKDLENEDKEKEKAARKEQMADAMKTLETGKERETLAPQKGDWLVVIDMQNDFITGSLGSGEARAILPKVENLIKLFHEKTSSLCSPDRIVYTLDTHGQDYENTLEGRKLPIRHCISGTAGHCLPDSLVALMDEYQATPVVKRTFGTFDFSPMGNDKASVIYICGLCTDICVVSNALVLRAKYPDNRIVCVSDCCAGTGKEAHEAALLVMKSCQIDVTEFHSLLEEEEA